MEKTFVMVKPDGVHRGLVGEIIGRFEQASLKIVALKMIHINNELAQTHYSEHVEKPFFSRLISFITSGPVVIMVLEGPRAVYMARKLIGSTNPLDASPGSIRGDFGLLVDHNIIHGSDGLESAKREIGLFFKEGEIQNYSTATDHWL